MFSNLFGWFWSGGQADPQDVVKRSFSKSNHPPKQQDPASLPHAAQSFPVQKLQKQQSRIEKLLAVNHERRVKDEKQMQRDARKSEYAQSNTTSPQSQEFVQACLSVLEERNRDPDTVHRSPLTQPASQLSAEALQQLRGDKNQQTTTGKQDLMRAHLATASKGRSDNVPIDAGVSPSSSQGSGPSKQTPVTSPLPNNSAMPPLPRKSSLPPSNPRAKSMTTAALVDSRLKTSNGQVLPSNNNRINILYNPNNLTAQENYDLTPVPYQYQSPYVANASEDGEEDKTAPADRSKLHSRAEEEDLTQLESEIDPSLHADNRITTVPSPAPRPARKSEVPEVRKGNVVPAAPTASAEDRVIYGEVLNVGDLSMHEILYNPKFVGKEKENYDLTPIPFQHLAHHS